MIMASAAFFDAWRAWMPAIRPMIDLHQSGYSPLRLNRDMPAKVVIIDGHPDPDEGRLCRALAASHAEAAAKAGHEVRRIGIASIDFPILKSKLDFEQEATASAILDAQEAIRWADQLVIVYPLWLGTMPALLKAFLEQVFRPGFAFEANSKGWPKKLLKGRRARIVITMGMPAFWYRWFYGAHSLRSLERNILKFCGVSPIRETIFGMVENASTSKRAKWLKLMATYGGRAD